tara:strand:- start:251 stop:883 length:633 start_codon:yes stop_codon:yes gene_type:complete
MENTLKQLFNEIQKLKFDSLSTQDIKNIEQFIKKLKISRKTNSNRKIDAGTIAYRNLTEDEKNEFIENEFSNKDKYPVKQYKNVYLAYRKFYKDTHIEDNLIDNDTQQAINDAEKILDNNSDSDSDSKVKSTVKLSKTKNSSKDKSLKKKQGKKKSKKVTNTTLSVSDIEHNSDDDDDEERDKDEEKQVLNNNIICTINSDNSDSDSDSE